MPLLVALTAPFPPSPGISPASDVPSVAKASSRPPWPTRMARFTAKVGGFASDPGPGRGRGWQGTGPGGAALLCQPAPALGSRPECCCDVHFSGDESGGRTRLGRIGRLTPPGPGVTADAARPVISARGRGRGPHCRGCRGGGPRDPTSEAWRGAGWRVSWGGGRRGALTTPSLHRMLREKLRAQGLRLRAGSGGPGPLRVTRRPTPALCTRSPLPPRSLGDPGTPRLALPQVTGGWNLVPGPCGLGVYRRPAPLGAPLPRVCHCHQRSLGGTALPPPPAPEASALSLRG